MHTVFPPPEDFELLLSRTPEQMRPVDTPYFVMAPEWLSPNECKQILYHGMTETPYVHSACGAITREMPYPLDRVYDPILDYVRLMNDTYFKYVIDDSGMAWLQTYNADGSYQNHADAAIGQTRKLTAVVMLSEEEAYSGGDLIMHTSFGDVKVSKKMGTIVVFQSHLLHEVTPVLSGTRQTLNVGIYGPRWQ